MKFIFIRHPETMANVNRIIYGQTDSEYSPKGWADVPWVVKEMTGEKVDYIYTSPLKRASYLAGEVAKVVEWKDPSQAGLREEPRMMEMHFGIFEGKTNQEARELYGEGYEAFWYDFNNFKVPGGETFDQVKERVEEFLKELLQEETAKRDPNDLTKPEDPRTKEERIRANSKVVVIVAHSLAIRAALSFLLNIPLDDIWKVEAKPAGIVEIDYTFNYGKLDSCRYQKHRD
ncbi:MAG: histidine phosphatase family protein [Firmicutes bacterium]|nr:histidine phosphatase family protein [Bacillota bacterium]